MTSRRQEVKKAGGQAGYVILNIILPVILNLFQDLVTRRPEGRKSRGQAVIGGQSPQDTCHCQRVKLPLQSQSSEISSVIFCSGTLPKRTYRPNVLASYCLLQSEPHPCPLFRPLQQYLLNFKVFEQVFPKEREYNSTKRTYPLKKSPLTLTLSRKGRGDDSKFPKRTYSPIDLLTYSLKKKRVAFTLAEVLITLGIIGVVAAMTMPAVINNAQNRQLEAGLKKAYSTINQALLLYENENGQPITPAATRHSVKPALIKYIKTVKDCGTGSTGEVAKACVPNNSFVENPDDEKEIYKTYNGNSKIALAAFDDGQFIINDGMLVLIENSAGTTQRVWISVDVNGYNKRPNRLGQDLFMFQISDDGHLLPMGAKGTSYYSETDEYCLVNGTSMMNGAGCTQKALYDKDFFLNLPR